MLGNESPEGSTRLELLIVHAQVRISYIGLLQVLYELLVQAFLMALYLTSGIFKIAYRADSLQVCSFYENGSKTETFTDSGSNPLTIDRLLMYGSNGAFNSSSGINV